MSCGPTYAMQMSCSVYPITWNDTHTDASRISLIFFQWCRMQKVRRRLVNYNTKWSRAEYMYDGVHKLEKDLKFISSESSEKFLSQKMQFEVTNIQHLIFSINCLSSRLALWWVEVMNTFSRNSSVVFVNAIHQRNIIKVRLAAIEQSFR